MNTKRSILTITLAVGMIAAFTAARDAVAQQDSVVNSAIAAFERLCGLQNTRDLNPAEIQVVEVFRVDAPEELSQPLTWESYSDSFIVPIAGRTFRKLPGEYWASAGAALENLSASSRIYGIWEQGIVGQVYCEADGSPYRIVEFERPAANPIGIRVYPEEVSRTVEAEAGTRSGNIKLLDMGYQDYVWEYDDGTRKHFVDAKTGTYVAQEAFDTITRDNWAARRNRPADVAGSSTYTNRRAQCSAGPLPSAWRSISSVNTSRTLTCRMSPWLRVLAHGTMIHVAQQCSATTHNHIPGGASIQAPVLSHMATMSDHLATRQCTITLTRITRSIVSRN